MKRFLRIITVTISIGVLMLFCSCMHTGGVIDVIQSAEPETSRVTSTKETKTTSIKTTKTEKTTSIDEKTTEKATEADTEAETESEEVESAENNKYFDLIDMDGFRDSLGTYHVIIKILAKKDVQANCTVIAYDDAGNVVEKSEDDIVLTEGEENFFELTFENDIKQLQLQDRLTFKNDSFLTGVRKGVEMVQYNKSGEYLYITFKQNVDKLDGFEKYKILLYNDDKIVGTESSYFCLETENLIGKDSTDIAEIWVWGTDFDRIEYYYEP